jgi:hypothetical protein
MRGRYEDRSPLEKRIERSGVVEERDVAKYV